MPAWRTAVVLGIAGSLFLLALIRLVTGRKTAPYPVALTDQVLTGVAVAVATSSLVITLAVLAFITGAIAMTFKRTSRLTILTSLAMSAPGVLTALVLDTGASDSDADYLAVIVLIILLLALAAFILGFFAIQARQLRRELSHQQTQLDAILDVTPVVLAAVASDRTVSGLAGDIESWRDLSGRQLPADSPIVQLIEESARGVRATDDIDIGGRTFSVTCDPGTGGDVLLTAYDVTEQTEARQRLEEVVRSKDQFIAAVSHELRTPLASVLGFSELVQERMGCTDPLQDMMTEVTDQSAEMAAIIDDLLVAARASFESVPLAPRQIDLAQESTAVIDTIGSRLSAIPECHFDTVTAFADPIRVRQIIRNLVTNADRYGGQQVKVETSTDNETAILIVRDSGNPLPPERREQIFQPYESSGPVRGQPAAIGLGLAVSRTLAELMGGTIEYDHDGVWSTFELRLPVEATSPLAPSDGSMVTT